MSWLKLYVMYLMKYDMLCAWLRPGTLLFLQFIKMDSIHKVVNIRIDNSNAFYSYVNTMKCVCTCVYVCVIPVIDNAIQINS